MQSSMTTVQNSSVNAAQHAKKPEKSGRYGTHGSADDGFANAFGDLFSSMALGAGRQDLAATAAGDGKASPAGLAAEVLGPAVHIITTTASVTSDDSLLAFARAQGMDENALAMIFGSPPAAEADPLADGEADALAGLGLDGDGLKLPLSTETGLNGKAGTGGSLALGPEASLRWQLGDAASEPTSDQPATQFMFGLNGLRTLMPAAQAAQAQQAAAAEPAASPEAANQSLAASLILGASEASQFARRLQLKQMSAPRADKAEARFGLSSGYTGTGAGPAAAGDSSRAADTALPAEALVLDASLTDADTQLLWQHRQGDGKMGTGQADGAGGSAAAAARSDLNLRAEQYERLSERLAESLGQRLAAQIAKGDWKVEMALHPSELGNIDIKLNMNKGQLEASFSASQPLTQALIADGLPKLKEMLAQMGMDVASMQVNVRQQGQHGGNSTPRREPSGVAGVSSKRGVEENAAVAVAPQSRPGGITKDGLDLLA